MKISLTLECEHTTHPKVRSSNDSIKRESKKVEYPTSDNEVKKKFYANNDGMKEAEI